MILNKPLYEGRAVWNRSQKVRDPDTGKRVMRIRPEEEWVWTDAPELRIIPEAVWKAVRERRAARRLTFRGHHQGTRPKYLLCGLLICGECGSHYIVQSKRQGVQWYGRAAHAERGLAICRNGRMIRRERIEQQLVDYVFRDTFTPLKLEFLDQVIERIVAQHAPEAGRGRAFAAKGTRACSGRAGAPERGDPLGHPDTYDEGHARGSRTSGRRV